MKKKNLPISEIMRIREIELGETASEIVNKKNDTSTGNYERCCFLTNQTAGKIYGWSDWRRSQKAESPRSGEKKVSAEICFKKAITYAMATLETNAPWG